MSDKLGSAAALTGMPGGTASSHAEIESTHMLEEAINSATTFRIKAVFLNMCQENIVCRDLASRALLIPSSGGQRSTPSCATNHESTKQTWRKAYEICRQCGEEYDVQRNESIEGLCVYHPGRRLCLCHSDLKKVLWPTHEMPGKKEVAYNADFWADHDPDCHGALESFVDNADYAEGWYQDSALPRDWVIATSSNGWTTNERGLEWNRHFDQYTKPRTTGKYRLLVLDGHESHHSTDFELYCKEHDIITLCMPAHSSHILQPLDMGYFGPLKRAYGGQIEKRVRADTTHISKEDFFPAFLAAFQTTMTVSNVQAGFRGAGLVPYDPESVIARLDVKLRTPRPEIRPPAETQAWVSKTPNNPTEAGSQSEFIKNRVSLHQGSSPTPILEAIDQFTKGATGIMHQIALLKSEVKRFERTMHY